MKQNQSQQHATRRPLNLTVFGAAGNVGSRVVAEALSRGHRVTAVVRGKSRLSALHPHANGQPGEAARVADVARLSAGRDVVIGATRPPAGQENELVEVARALLAGTTEAKTRLLLVGGAASLTLPGTSGTRVIDDPAYCPAPWQPIARACLAQLAACRAAPDASWTYLSPPALLAPGQRTGRYRVGRDELLVDDRGESGISMEDLAVALLDEAENPRHRQARFTVAH